MASMSASASTDTASPDPKKCQVTGTELEIRDEHVKSERDSLKIVIRKRFNSFGLATNFHDAPETFFEILPFDDKAFSVHKILLNKGVQVTPEVTEGFCQSVISRTRNAWTHYEPRLFDEEEREAILTSDSLKDFVLSSANGLGRALQQQELVNVFEKCGNDNVRGSTKLKKIPPCWVLANEKLCTGKMVSCIEWHPRRIDLAAIAYIDGGSYESKIDRMSSLLLQPRYVLLWHLNDKVGMPKLILESPSEVQVLRFHPFDHKYLIAGCDNGFVVVWDVSFDESTVGANSEMEVRQWLRLASIGDGHRHCVVGIYWIPGPVQVQRTQSVTPDNAVQQYFFTISTDGSIYLWDYASSHEENWSPLQKIKCFRSTFCWLVSAFTVICEETAEPKLTMYRRYRAIGEEEINSLYFIIGCEDGNLIQWNWKSYLAEATTPKYLPKIHDGRICSVNRSPHFEHLWLAAGGKCASVWFQNGVLFTMDTRHGDLSDGQWSPSCPGMFFLLTTDGCLEIWVIDVETFSAVHVEKLSSEETLRLSVTHSYLCVGTRTTGTVLISESHFFTLKPMPDIEELIQLFNWQIEHKPITVVKEIVKKPTKIILYRAVEDETEDEKLQKEYDSYLKLEKEMLAKIKDYGRNPDNE